MQSKVLTVFSYSNHTYPLTAQSLKRKAIEKLVGKEKMLMTSNFSFFCKVFTIPKTYFDVFMTSFILLFANAFHLDQP